MAKPDPPEQVNHGLQKAHRCESHLQPSPQWWNEGRNERQVDRWLFPKIGPIEDEFEVLQMLKKPDEVYDLSVGPSGFPQAKRPERWQEALKVPPNPWYEIGDVQILNLKFLDIGQRRNLAEGATVEQHWRQANFVVVASVYP